MCLEIKSLSKIYGSKKVVENVSFKVKKGSAYGLLGRNGAGKTTLIRMILGIIKEDSGEVFLDGVRLDTSKVKLAYLPEDRGVYARSKVKDFLFYFGRLSGLTNKNLKREVEKWAQIFKIEEYYSRTIESLSKGNQQKVQIIASILNDPDIIVFDEPFSGLDPVNSKILRNVVIDFIKQGKYIIFSSHQMNYVEEFCRSVSILKNGRQIVKGSLLNIKKSFGVKSLYLEIDSNLPNFNSLDGVVHIKKTYKGYQIAVDNDYIADYILKILVGMGIRIFKFNLEYKSLNEIFIDTVGD